MKKLWLATVVVAMLISACSDDTPTLSLTSEEEEAKEIAASYLNAWEDMNYDAMYSHLISGSMWWVEAMENFPVPFRDWKIEGVRTEDSKIVIEYSVQAPNLGCIVSAFADDNPEDKARLLLLDGTFTTWEDTLRLAKENGDYKILTNTETEEASNRLADYIFGLGLYIVLPQSPHPIEDVQSRFASALATYGVEFDMSAEELEKMLPEIINQLKGCIE